MIVSDEQQRDSVTHFHVFILPRTTLCGLFENVPSDWSQVIPRWRFYFPFSHNKWCGGIFSGFFFSFFKEIVCVKLTSSQWLLEGLPCPDRFLITYGRTLLEVGCPLQPHRLCEYEVTLGADFQVVITEGVHKAAALLVPRAVSSGNRSLGTVAILVWRLEWETPGRLCRYFFPPPCTCQTNPKFCWDSDAEGAVLPRWGHFSKLFQALVSKIL